MWPLGGDDALDFERWLSQVQDQPVLTDATAASARPRRPPCPAAPRRCQGVRRSGGFRPSRRLNRYPRRKRGNSIIGTMPPSIPSVMLAMPVKADAAADHGVGKQSHGGR